MALLPCSPPCSEPDRRRNALISPAWQQPAKTSRACLKPRQRGGMPGGRDRGGGRLSHGSRHAGSVPGRESFTLYNHHPRLGHPRPREGPGMVGQSRAAPPSPAGDGPSFFPPLCILYDAKHQVRGCVRYRGTKAGGRLPSAHTSHLCLPGRKEPFVWKQQLLPQKHARAKARVTYRSRFAQNGTGSPR